MESLGFKVFAFGIHENTTQLVATDSVVNVFTPQLTSYLHAVLTAGMYVGANGYTLHLYVHVLVHTAFILNFPAKTIINFDFHIHTITAQPPVIPMAQQLSLNSTFSSPNSAVLISSHSTKSSMIPLSCPSSSLNSPSLISPPDPPPPPNSFLACL